jgi:hypothetical protein
MTQVEFGDIREAIPERAVFIIGAGRFGSRAARLLGQGPDIPIFVVETDEKRLTNLDSLSVTRIPGDGIRFLAGNADLISPTCTVVPAIPVHLAFEWLRRYLGHGYQVKKIDVPKAIKPFLPHSWPGSEGSLLVSYADFMCPDDCPEPDCCSVTGQRREHPLHDLLRRIDLVGFRNYVIQSRQLAPGLGGYAMADLLKTAEAIAGSKREKWLLSTACKCHGILTALEVQPVL